MSETVCFSFIIPAYKAKFLHLSIESILMQSYRDFELIIVNDASPENLKTIIEQYSDKRINYQENGTNIGGTDLVANWNHCIQFAKNDYIILATDDDMFEPDFLIKAVDLINKYPNINIIRSGVRKIDEQGRTLDIEFPLKEYMTGREFTLYYAKGGTISCISNYIFERKELLSIGGFISFPHAHYSDDATALTMSINGIACIPTNELNFRVSNINLSNRNNQFLAIEQLHASEAYVTWFFKHMSIYEINPNDFFQRACYGGIKNRYINMVEKLIDKIPFSKAFLAIKTIYSAKHLFKKDKLKLTANWIINKL